MGAAGFADRRARASYTDAAVTEPSECLHYIYLGTFPGRETPEHFGRMRRRAPTSPGVQAGSRGPSSTLYIHVATGSDEFLHFGNGQSESSRTIYRNFETEHAWSVLLKMQETHF